MGFSFEDWFNKVKVGDVVLEYQGEITSALITKVLSEVEEQLEKRTGDIKIIRKVYNVLVETLQNLYHHSIHNVMLNGGTAKNKYAAFVVCVNSSDFSVSTGNYVKKEKVQILKDRIDQINSLSKEELKSLYKLILNNQEFSDKGGGGLGMIDISKRTGSKLSYYFYDINEVFSFYHLLIDVS